MLAAGKERFRWWVIILGAVLIPVNSLWIARAEALDYSGFPTCASLFYNVIFSLIFLLLLNVAVRWLRPSWALGRGELLVVYGMLATGSSLVGHDCMQMLVPAIPHVAYFATPENRWHDLITPNLPDWLTIKTAGESIEKYELGHSSLYNWQYFKVWITPMAAWSLFLFAVSGCMLSINLLLRKHWVEHERLSYPVVQIPILMTEGGGRAQIFKSRLFSLGFAIAAGIDLLNGFARFYPTLPSINTKLTDISYIFAGSNPWRAAGWTVISFYPFVIGLSFFMPTNIAFSSWFFFFFRKAQQISAAAFGYQGTDPWFPYLREQSYGALIALCIAALWYGRGYVKEIWKAGWSSRGSDGGVGYRTVFMALAGCLIVMIGFLCAAGMTWWVAVSYVVLFMLFCFGITRIRAELGPPSHEFGWVGTSQLMVLGLGTLVLGPKNLTLFSLLWFQNRMHRGLLMPQQAESLKAASESGLKIRTMAIALAIAAVIGVLSAFWALLHLGYGRPYASPHPGAPGSGFSQESCNVLVSYLTTPVRPSFWAAAGAGIGAVAALVLARLSVNIYGFPFHPAGYAIGMSFGMDYIWLPVMISWLLKVLILRYAGLKGYRSAIPFFVGLVLGEFTVGGFWSFVRGVLGVQTYTFFIF